MPHAWPPVLLPEEIIADILWQSLFIPHADFLHLNRRGQHTPLPRSAHLLLVCKSWLRLGTPLLYACVRLETRQHTDTVAALVRTHHEIGSAIRCLRLEGGHTPGLVDIAHLAPNLRSVYINMEGVPEGSNRALENALPHLRLATLCIRETKRGSDKIAEVRSVLNKHIQDTWTSLRSVSVSDEFSIAEPAVQSLGLALAQSTVEEVDCYEEIFFTWLIAPLFPRLLERMSLRHVICRGMVMEAVMLRMFLDRCGYPPETIQKVTIIP